MPPTAGKASWQSQAESVWGEAITTQSKRRKNAKTAHRDFTDQSLTCADPLKNEARVCLLRIRRPVSTPGRDAVGSNRARRVARQWALHRFELRLRGRDPGSGASVMIGATAREDFGALRRSTARRRRCERERKLGLNQGAQGRVHGCRVKGLSGREGRPGPCTVRARCPRPGTNRAPRFSADAAWPPLAVTPDARNGPHIGLLPESSDPA